MATVKNVSKTAVLQTVAITSSGTLTNPATAADPDKWNYNDGSDDYVFYTNETPVIDTDYVAVSTIGGQRNFLLKGADYDRNWIAVA